MAEHQVFDYAQDGFRKFAPKHLHEAATRLEAVYNAHADRLETGRASIRQGRQQYCHYISPRGRPDHRIGVFNVHNYQGVIELYHPGALTAATRARCGHMQVGRDHARIALPHPSKIRFDIKGHMAVESAIAVLREYLDALDHLIKAGVAKSSGSEGELVVFRALPAADGWQHRVRPAFIHKRTGRRLELDFWCQARACGIEVMGGQHFNDVELWGGSSSRVGANERTCMKLRACAEEGVALVLAHWDTDAVLHRSREGELYALIEKGLNISRASGRWVDLDEMMTERRFAGYDFLRRAGLPSALDGKGADLTPYTSSCSGMSAAE